MDDYKEGISCENCGGNTFVRRTLKEEKQIKRIRICKRCTAKRVTTEK